VVPFGGSSNRAVMASILQRRRPERPAHPTFTEDWWSLLQHRWNDNPNSRPPAPEVWEILEVLTSGRSANQVLTKPECIRLINVTFSDHNWTRVTNHFYGEYAQNFIDVADEVSRQSVVRLLDKLIDGGSHFHVFSIRCWRTSHQRFAGDVCPP
jgi:hypothetical protein